jgi:PIN domain nuclease of toxin-antitoxin system
VSKVVLDGSAVLALLAGEPGAEVVSACVPDAAVSTVNVAEIGMKLADRGMAENEVRSAISTLGLEVVVFDEDAAYTTAALRSRTRSLGLSLGDRACLALGETRSLPVLTADRNWAGLKLGVEIRVIRGP